MNILWTYLRPHGKLALLALLTLVAKTLVEWTLSLK